MGRRMSHAVPTDRHAAPGDRLLAWVFTGVPALGLLFFFGYPLLVIGLRSILGEGDVPTLAHYRRLWTTPGLPGVMLHTLWVSGATMVLATADGTEWFEAERIATANTHGTGCTLSSAIAAELAKGANASEAVRAAKTYLAGAIAAAERLSVGSGHGPVHHFHALWREDR